MVEATRLGEKEVTAAEEVWEAREGKVEQAAKATPMHRLPPPFTQVCCVAFLYGDIRDVV